MPEFLKLAQLPQGDRVTKMNVRRRGVDAELHPQGLAARELFRELLLAVDRDGAALENFELFRDRWHEPRSVPFPP